MIGRPNSPHVVCPACGHPGRLYRRSTRGFVRHAGTTLRPAWYRYCWLSDEQASAAQPARKGDK